MLFVSFVEYNFHQPQNHRPRDVWKDQGCEVKAVSSRLKNTENTAHPLQKFSQESLFFSSSFPPPSSSLIHHQQEAQRSVDDERSTAVEQIIVEKFH